MLYGYSRVSSIGQAKDGNSIEAQTAALQERGCDEIYHEVYTGTTTDRPELMKILAKIQKGDTLNVDMIVALDGEDFSICANFQSDLKDDIMKLNAGDMLTFTGKCIAPELWYNCTIVEVD